MGGLIAAGAGADPASAATPQQLDLKILLVGEGPADVTTAAWQAALTSEGVPYTMVTATGTAGAETVSLPALSSGSTGDYNGVVIADSPTDYAAGALSALDSYESSFAVRQVDGYMFPSPALGVTEVTGGALNGATAALTTAGLAAFPELKGPVPFDTGSFGYGATVDAGAPYTPFLTDAAGHVMAGVYQHPGTDAQAGVSELALNFNYNASQLQWLLLAPGLINWVTQDTHLGLYRNYFGQDIDDVFIADNEWSSTYQCTPGATEPPDFTCPPGVANNPADTPPDVQMSAADVAHVVSWEQQTGLKLSLAFNGIGACTAPSAAAEPATANCTGSATDPGGTFTDPGEVIDTSYPNDGALIDALLASQGDFNWITHTWSHLFLGCQAWQPQALTSATAGPGGSLSAGSYSYEITAATAYGESEPSTAQPVTVGANGSVTLTWPEATNGVGDDGTTPGPSLAQLESGFGGGTGFWGYNIYRADQGSTSYQLVGQVPENNNATSSTTYTFSDTGTAPQGGPPGSSDTFPSATNPGIDCGSPAGSWLPASSTSPDSSIEQEIGLDQAFAAANGLTNFSPAAVVTGEHSGLESPNMPAALNATGITTFAQDGSRQPQQYSLGGARGAPRYPSNIYYNAATWADELNEYNTLYVAQGTPIGTGSETGRCTGTTSTTCLTTPADEAAVLASESHIMLGHVLGNNPRVGYAHQSDLIGPDYTILALISDMQSQYDSWFNTDPTTGGATLLDQMTDTTEAQVLAEQGAWASAEPGSNYSASEQNGVVTVTNSGPEVKIPVTVPPGTTVNGGSGFGESYGGTLSDWVDLGTGATETLTEAGVAPSITSASSATSTAGTPFSFIVTATGTPAPALTESGALPTGITFTDNGNGTATIAGTAASGTGGSYPILITATSGAGAVSTGFTLSNDEAPAITSASTATFTTGVAGTYTVTTTGFPAPAIALSPASGPLPAGLALTDNGNGTATISGTPGSATAGSYPVSVSATTSGSTATLGLTITVNAAAAPILTVPAADFTLNQAGDVTITATGSPTPKITETGTVPAGLTFNDNGDGTATLSGTPTATGTTSLTITASNGISPDATQTMPVVVGGPPAFTSASSAAATAGSPFSFTVKTSGSPPPSFGWDNVPPGLTFTPNTDGTATLSGTPTTAGTYAMDLSASNSYGTAAQTLTITVEQAPAITSGGSATFTVGTLGTVTVTTTGSPTAKITGTGNLPSGVTLADNSDGTATLAGTPAPGTSGSYPITITASNGVSPDATQSFTLTVNAAPTAPAITSGNAAAFTAGAQGSFSVTTTGSPTAKITGTGNLPSGVTLADNSDGTATLAGTPAPGTSGSYPITITAANGVSPDATQSFTLTVNPANTAPVITSAGAATFAAGTAGTFTVTATGVPAAKLSATSSPALPSGVTFTGNGDGTATLAGTPPAGSQGTYALTVTASNSVGTATQTLVLTVNSGLAITSASSATAIAGSAFSFTVTTTGTAALTHTGTLPSGVTFTDNGNGTATLSGTLAAADHGVYPITFTARNPTGTASQAFTLTVSQAPAITSAAAITETAAAAFSFTVTTTGYPTAALTSGPPPSGVSFSDNGNGTATLSGTAPATAGTYTVPITAKNSGGTTSQTITLTVTAAGTRPVPAFTSAASATAAAGTAFRFTVTTAGSPTTYTTNVTRTGTLPAGVSFTNNGNGTATLSGTPAAASGGTYPITFRAATGGETTTQAFVLTVSARPAISTAGSTTATVGSGFSFTVKATGAPIPALTENGTLPQGLTWADNGNGTATLAGTPGVGQGGVYHLTLAAANTGGTTTQSFTLTVRQAPAITSAATATATHGNAFTFTFTAAGYPVPNVTHTGRVRGLTYTNNGNGTATLSGTPAAAGTYVVTITARNSVGSATQTFTLTVS